MNLTRTCTVACRLLALAPAAVLGAALAPVAAAATPVYRIEPLKSQGAIQPAVAYAVNAHGVVTGSAWNFVTGHYVCFRYEAGVLTELPDSADRVCTGINDQGDIVGGPNLVQGMDDGLSYLWPAAGGRVELVGMTMATAINNRGDVAGWSTFGGRKAHAAWITGGVLVDLGASHGLKGESAANGLNDKGLVVGTGATRDTASQAVKWSQGAMKKIPSPDGPLSTALAVNRLGHVVGTTGPDADQHGAYLQDKTGVHALPAIPRTSLMTPRAINDTDMVVGSMLTEAGRNAAFFSDEGKSYWLYGLLDDSGQAWSSLSQAWGINQAGQVVGVGFYVGEGNVPFIATPVAP
ncbi:MAG: hypothetical protein U1F53_08595 [Burkholderiaceae bacterium]